MRSATIAPRARPPVHAGPAFFNRHGNAAIDTALLMLIVLLGFATWGVVIYNRLVRDANNVKAGWSDIGVQLKRRHDLIPKLIDAVKAYADYERATIAAVTELRSQSANAQRPAAIAEIEARLGAGVARLIAVAEAYPELKANASFLSLQQDISDTENHLQLARRYYNGAVRIFNTRVLSFPDLFVARPFGYREAEYFEAGLDSSGDGDRP